MVQGIFLVSSLLHSTITVLQEKEALKGSYSKCLEENDQLRDSLESEQLLSQQLSAKVEVLSFQLVELKEKEKEIKVV